MDTEETSLHTSIARWMRELTIRGDENLTVNEQVQLIEELNPPRARHFGVKTPLSREQRHAVYDTLDELREELHYDKCAHLAVDEALLFLLRQATGKTRGELIQQVSVMLEDMPELKFRDGPSTD